MFIIFLRFADKSKAPPLMKAHSSWIKQGFDDGIFALAGSLQPAAGGAIIAHGLSQAEIEQRISEDPFVAQGAVLPEIVEIAPAIVDERLAFLKG